MASSTASLNLQAPLVLGIDPGFTGALAIIDPVQRSIEALFAMPVSTSPTNGKKSVDPQKLAEFLRPFQNSIRYAVVEAVSSAPGQGVVSVFSFGQGYGTVLGVLGTLGITTRYAHPAVWKKAMGLSSYKRESNDMAQRVFPKSADEFVLAKNNGKAEAVLIAWYGAKLTGFQTGSTEFSNLL